ncbi:hypothetical protein [Brevibacillus porteri]|uniref:hypothetical protein n=1 Tax=Brevibacillus porteri TaxID=2126350 RepID=UPI00363028F9
MFEQFPEEDGIMTFRPVGGTIEYGEDSKSAVKGRIFLKDLLNNFSSYVMDYSGRCEGTNNVEKR